MKAEWPKGEVVTDGGPTLFRTSALLSLALVGALGLASCSDSGPADPPSVATTLSAEEGMGLQAPAGTILPAGPTVRVLDQYGEPMEGIVVSFDVQEGEGLAVIRQRETDVWGRARSTWILGSEAGSPQRLRASVEDLTLDFTAEAIEALAGESYSGREAYIQYYAGDLPLVISAPHGGTRETGEIPDRTWGTVGRDTNTEELALQIRDAIHAAAGGYPHLVISHLRRIKLDPNREIEEAAQGDPEAERAWWEYHTFLERAGELVEEDFGEGLYIDLHGHGHANQRLELGYLLTSTDLTRPDEGLAQAAYAEKSSFRALAEQATMDFASLIRGPQSLGTLMESRGFPAVPSQAQPDPGGEPYFSGGYSTARHGSSQGGTVSGVQIECNYTGVRNNATNREAFAVALTESLQILFPVAFGLELTTETSSEATGSGSPVGARPLRPRNASVANAAGGT